MMDNYPECRLIRSEALKWWALLTDSERAIYRDAHYPGQHVNALRGSDIETMYATACE